VFDTVVDVIWAPVALVKDEHLAVYRITRVHATCNAESNYN
jgi:hypothetical protein